MYKITIFSVGKTKESWLLEAISEYEKRLKATIDLQWVFVKKSEQLDALLEQVPFIALTPEAKQYSSEEFSFQMHHFLEKLGSRIAFLIGGAEGIAPKLLTKAFATISFSKMTFTHQMVRLLLIEQIYRATEIEK
ncbi:MAG: 23S rRNA (pseudouridine(1915)-N(3))-methyltransferase RlmH, partial [Verrucomicrobia bacterium]|nr:23S rRNA (pseudouridine(1915)-N(3))-methyltransferase RlmH [Verrucomicrobiota bacterium]